MKRLYTYISNKKNKLLTKTYSAITDVTSRDISVSAII